jgi:hypothetical protein
MTAEPTNWEGRFDFNRYLKRYLEPDDMLDMDESLDQHLTSGVGQAGAIVAPSGESVHRIRDPLSADAERNFGQYALEALAQKDLYLEGEDKPSGL